MTMQIGDVFLWEDVAWGIPSCPLDFALDEYGLSPEWASTNNYRGYVSEFTVIKGRFCLKNLHVNLSEEQRPDPPPLFGKNALYGRVIFRCNTSYADLDRPIDVTGVLNAGALLAHGATELGFRFAKGQLVEICNAAQGICSALDKLKSQATHYRHPKWRQTAQSLSDRIVETLVNTIPEWGAITAELVSLDKDIVDTTAALLQALLDVSPQNRLLATAAVVRILDREETCRDYDYDQTRKRYAKDVRDSLPRAVRVSHRVKSPEHIEVVKPWVKAKLSGANLSGANLNRVDFARADLDGRDLSGAGLFRINLAGATLDRADLSHADLREANLQGAVLCGANLTGADLWEANLHRADLSEANLVGASLHGADLRGTNFRGCRFSLTSFHEAKVDAETVLSEKWHLVWEVTRQPREARLAPDEKLLGKLRQADLSDANLGHTDLRKADLTEAKLSGAVFLAADLRGANLSGADLADAEFAGADLREANMMGVQLQNADLGHAELDKANFTGAILSQANLDSVQGSAANLSRTDFSEANLSGANLAGADLSGANLGAADLHGAVLDKADLRGVDLSKANLNGASLREANLVGANLAGADLNTAQLFGADLTGANLSGANLEKAWLRKAKLTKAILTDADLYSSASVGEESDPAPVPVPRRKDFDPYYAWLGIPPDEQPPNHYRLLGVKKYETDSDVIECAADRQMVHLRRFAGGRRVELSQRLVNEVSAARTCLLDTKAKLAYDAELRKKTPPPEG